MMAIMVTCGLTLSTLKESLRRLRKIKFATLLNEPSVTKTKRIALTLGHFKQKEKSN